MLARRGDPDAGAVLVKINLLGAGFRVLVRVQGADGKPGWLAGTGDAPVAEADAEAYIKRAIDRDYDLWVVEIEDKEGRTPFDEPLVT